MSDSQRTTTYQPHRFREATEDAPAGSDVVRECKQLQHYRLLDVLSEGLGGIEVRLTPQGRDTWESFLSRRESDPAADLLPQ